LPNLRIPAGSALPAIVFLLLGLLRPVAAQDSTVVQLPGLRIEASRGSLDRDHAPAAVSILTRDEGRRRTEPALSLESILSEMPGVWMADRTHLALGERLVIRGFGSRAAFGVRSIAVLLDGVLLTMPDGQAVLDPVEPAVVSRVELIRGPASRFWGNAAGGVMSIESGAYPLEGVEVRIRGLSGAFGTGQALAEVAATGRRHQTTAYVSRLNRSGYRDFADGAMSRAGIRSRVPLGSGAVLSLAFNLSDLDTESPGSLTAAQWAEDPSAADPRYVNTSSGKRATQLQASTGLTANLGPGLLSASLFGVTRSLDNPLPFAWIGLERVAGGGRADWRFQSEDLSLGLAADWRLQVDDRVNTENREGRRGESVRLDQRESIGAFGGSLVGETRLSSSISASGGLRIDRLSVEMKDHLLDNGNQSGREFFLAASPSFGIRYARGPSVVFGSFSTAFEIPTTTELVNRPDGLGGFNPDLKPQRTAGFEVGLRLDRGAMHLDVAGYRQHLTNFLSPYQLENGDGRTFYRNVGSVDYSGVEVGWKLTVSPAVVVDGTASIHRYEFRSGAQKGRTVPGVPSRFASVRMAAARGPVMGSARMRLAGAQFADDANATKIDGFLVIDLRAAGRNLGRSSLSIAPFLEITNLLDANHVVSIVVNARGGRYYEGAPGRALTMGVDLRF
jgi:iron complex outermembrane recepter protein